MCVGGSGGAAAPPAVWRPQPAGAPPAGSGIVFRTRAAEPRAPGRPLRGVARLERCALRQPAAAGCGCCRLHLVLSPTAMLAAMRQECATETGGAAGTVQLRGAAELEAAATVQIPAAGWGRGSMAIRPCWIGMLRHEMLPKVGGGNWKPPCPFGSLRLDSKAVNSTWGPFQRVHMRGSRLLGRLASAWPSSGQEGFAGIRGLSQPGDWHGLARDAIAK